MADLDFALSEIADSIRQTTCRFAADPIAPLAARIDAEDSFPRELWPEMGALGLHGITVEEEYGGLGLGYLEHVGGLAMSEAGAGSDGVSMKLRAERVDGGYRLNGTKFWIANAAYARDHYQIESETQRMGFCEAGQAIVEPADHASAMAALAFGAHASRRFDCNHLIAARRKPCGVTPGTRSDIECDGIAHLFGEQAEDCIVDTEQGRVVVARGKVARLRVIDCNRCVAAAHCNGRLRWVISSSSRAAISFQRAIPARSPASASAPIRSAS
jgi:hypothetical protein